MNIPVPIILPDWEKLNTKERRAIFEPLWLANITARDIAYLYFKNATRNAVLGAIHRAKLPKKPARIPKQAKIVRQPVPERIVQFIEPTDPAEHQSVLEMIATNRPPLAGTVPVSLTDLPNRPGVRCRFPVIGGYCGADCGDKMYCETHHAVMYRPTDKLRMPKGARL